MLVQVFTVTNDWSEFLKIKEDLAVSLIEIVEANKAAFAFPSQSLYIEKFPGEKSEIFTFPGSREKFSKYPQKCSGGHGNAFFTTLDTKSARPNDNYEPVALIFRS